MRHVAQGYDMEDAMIINKASYERGFGHASVPPLLLLCRPLLLLCRPMLML